MVFNSYTFLIFFAFVVLLHYSRLPWWGKKLNLLVASYLFYAAWNPPFVALLWLSTVVDWFAARGLYAARHRVARWVFLGISLAVNLGMLGFFKYGQFLLDNLVVMLSWVGVEARFVPPDIILPVGISFYTFQTLSYTLDVYRGQLRPARSFLDYALYVTFFPQLVAGPIVRAVDFLPQCVEPRRATGRQMGWGLVLLLVGMFEKIVVADGLLAPVVERVYDAAGSPDTLSAWCGTLAFAGQIFCDFSGYSTCAIGVAMCLGFSLPDNFRFPYAAIGLSDFWRRWHMSLSTWLRDYLYIPLGGNRRGSVRTNVNLMTTMLLGGLWHGASWTFVIWGGLHGMYLILERWLTRVVPGGWWWRARPVRVVLALLTFVLVCVAWVFFRAKRLDQSLTITAAMFGWVADEAAIELNSSDVGVSLGVTLALLGLHGFLRDQTLEDASSRCPWWINSLWVTGMILAIIFSPGEDRAFIYFQF